MLSITDLRKRYGNGPEVLKGVDLTVDGPGLTAIIGSSGAGKSTLLRCINRLVEPTSGRILVSGVDVTHLRGRRLRHARRSIGMIFQSFNLIERLTVMENVLSGRLGYVGFGQAMFRRYPQRDVDRAFGLLERVGLEDYVNARADTLSGGQRQRVGVVRALMQEPKILLADEPTASLDPKTSLQIMGLTRELSDELALPVLVNIHNVHQARSFADRVVGLKDGVIVFDGRGEELTDAVLEDVYGGSIETLDDGGTGAAPAGRAADGAGAARPEVAPR